MAAATCAKQVHGEVYGESFAVASTLIGVAALGSPDLMIEIKCVARRLSVTSSHDAVQLLVDRDEIHDIVMRYTAGVDRRDMGWWGRASPPTSRSKAGAEGSPTAIR